MLKWIIKVLIVGAVLHAAVRIGPVFYTHYKFRDALAETAKFSNRRTADEVLDRAARIAQEHEMPLRREDFQVTRNKLQTSIATRYTAQLEYFPRRYYPWEFVIHVEGEPPRYGEFMP